MSTKRWSPNLSWVRVLTRGNRKLQTLEIEEVQDLSNWFYTNTTTNRFRPIRGLSLSQLNNYVYVSKGLVLASINGSTYPIRVPSANISIPSTIGDFIVGVRVTPSILSSTPITRDPLLGGSIVGSTGMDRLVLTALITLNDNNSIPIGLITTRANGLPPLIHTYKDQPNSINPLGLQEPELTQLIEDESGDFIAYGLNLVISGSRLLIYPGRAYINSYPVDLSNISTLELTNNSNIYLSTLGNLITSPTTYSTTLEDVTNPIVSTTLQPITNSASEALLSLIEPSEQYIPLDHLSRPDSKLLLIGQVIDGVVRSSPPRRITKVGVERLANQVSKLERDLSETKLLYEQYYRTIASVSPINHADSLTTTEGSNIYHYLYKATLTPRGISSYLSKELLSATNTASTGVREVLSNGLAVSVVANYTRAPLVEQRSISSSISLSRTYPSVSLEYSPSALVRDSTNYLYNLSTSSPISTRDLSLKYSSLPPLSANYELYLNDTYITNYTQAPYTLSTGLSTSDDGSLSLVLDIPITIYGPPIIATLRRNNLVVHTTSIPVLEPSNQLVSPTPVVHTPLMGSLAQSFNIAQPTNLVGLELSIPSISNPPNLDTLVLRAYVYTSSLGKPHSLLSRGKLSLANTILNLGAWSFIELEHPLDLLPGTYFIVIEAAISGITLSTNTDGAPSLVGNNPSTTLPSTNLLLLGTSWTPVPNKDLALVLYKGNPTTLSYTYNLLLSSSTNYSVVEYLVSTREALSVEELSDTEWVPLNTTSLSSSTKTIRLSASTTPLPLIDIASTYFTGGHYEPTSTWVSKYLEYLQAYNYTEVILDAELYGSNYIRVFISSNSGQSWDELTQVSKQLVDADTNKYELTLSSLLTNELNYTDEHSNTITINRTTMLIRVSMYSDTTTPVTISNLRLSAYFK